MTSALQRACRGKPCRTLEHVRQLWLSHRRRLRKQGRTPHHKWHIERLTLEVLRQPPFNGAVELAYYILGPAGLCCRYWIEVRARWKGGRTRYFTLNVEWHCGGLSHRIFGKPTESRPCPTGSIGELNGMNHAHENFENSMKISDFALRLQPRRACKSDTNNREWTTYAP